MRGMMRSDPVVCYGSFVPVCHIFRTRAGTLVPLPYGQPNKLSSATRLMRVKAADKIRSPAFVARFAGKLPDEELMRPEKTMRKFIGSY